MSRRRAATRRLIPLAALAIALCAPGSAPAFDNQGWGVLDDGRLGDYEWSVKAKREGGPAIAGSRTARPPCILVGVQREMSPFSLRRIRFRSCAEGSGRLGATEAPLIASSSLTTSGSSPEVTAVGVIVSAAVRRVRVTLSDGSHRTFPVERLNRGQTTSTGLGRARYAAFSVRGKWEAERVVTLSARGRALWDSAVAEPASP